LQGKQEDKQEGKDSIKSLYSILGWFYWQIYPSVVELESIERDKAISHLPSNAKFGRYF